MKIKHWISAFRLRTLFLSLSCIGAGLFCAKLEGNLNIALAIFTITTALFLQILSNLANDYGDSIHGADHKARKGPARAVQAGHISPEQMKTGIIVFSSLALLSGTVLLFLAIDTIGKMGSGILFIVGLLSIAAAIAYTNGKKPYGYIGLGDISVFVFFGLIAVLGTYYLQVAELKSGCFFLAFTYGFLSVGVLNLNNMRDIDSDKAAGKLSIPVRLGLKQAKMYHYLLLVIAGFCFTIFTFQAELNWLILLPSLAILFFNGRAVYKTQKSGELDPLLKYLSFSTLLITLFLFLSSLI